MMAILIWLFAGVFFFITARAALHWAAYDQCKPITVGTVFMFLFFVWVWPASALATLIWFLIGVSEHHKHILNRFWNFQLANPRKWLSREREASEKQP